jgi:hypothetical protein
MFRWLLLAAGLLTACSRDLQIPEAVTLAVNPGFAALAPRESLTLVASGGAGGYRWSFEQGGRLSGSDATLDSGTGVYRAGALGSAQDVVTVTDQTGAKATARLSVGPRLSLSPALTGTAPGGSVAFTASGGKPPYQFTMAPGSGGQVDAAGHYLAGPGGDATDRVVVTDATLDAAANASAEVRVGTALTVYRGSSAAVAPREQVPFVAFGGQPPYTWSLSSNGSGGSIDAATGAYTAGLAGNATDRVTVTDANAQVSSAAVTVGPVLSLTLFSSAVRPGVATQLQAAGGKPPYAFAFAPKGNRSAGALDRITGLYTPGGNVGAVDRLQVTDATGTTAALAPPPVVGPYRFRVSGAVGDIQATDLNGDGRQDLVLVSPRFDQADRLTTFVWPVDSAPSLEAYFVPGNPVHSVGTSPPLVLLSAVGTDRLLLPDPGGRLLSGPTVPGNGLGVLASDGATFLSWVGSTCVTSGWTRIVWSAGATTIPLSCLPGALPGSNVLALAMGRFGGDGTLPDLAWVDSPGNSTTPLRVLRASAGGYLSASLALPAGTTFAGTPLQLKAATFRSGRFVNTSGSVDDVALLLTGADGRARLAVATGLNATPTWVGTPVEPMPAGSPPAVGFVAYLPAPAAGGVPAPAGFGAWSGLDGTLAIGRLPSGGALTFAAPVTLTDSAITSAVTADVNGDGVVDLALASSSSEAVDVLWGDGDGGFGRRAHFQVGSFATGDVDGDGADDLVTITPGPGLAVLFGGAHQYAQGPETTIPRAADQVLAGDFLGARHVDALYQERIGGLYLAAGAADGSFAQPRPILDAGGALDRRPLQNILPAHFGGAGGLDLVGYDPAASGLVAVVRDGPHLAHRVALPSNCGAGAQPVDLDGDGVDDLVTACGLGGGKTAFYTSLATGRGATLQFGAWVQATPIVTGSSPTLVGRQGGGALYLQVATVYRVDRTGTGVHATGGGGLPFVSGILGVLTPGGPTAIVARSVNGLTVLTPNSGGTYSVTQTLQAPGRPAAFVTPGRDALGQPLPADVLMATGEEVIPLVQSSGVLQ